MQYLLIDPHQRLLGTLNSEKVLSVGDTFENHNAQFYTVIGLNWFKQRSQAQSLTVIPAKPAKAVAQ
ncbi:hypothetical protein [Thermocoleostomius sinensis]|jgi:hypothetical protein|uniref:Uncharacterized protein n=1 Tax=Thermocoleostomius sinensis A174 TaxID=2016057 RepID=A0A9E8ZJH7_9CYAN|nr:hypothetical protein [Thermocoleostomius sinensis]WAL62355.1 hypothetical protein OXH18_10310 [Thermocoleostomius sinensis A174]